VAGNLDNVTVTHNEAAARFEMLIDGLPAVLTYRPFPDGIVYRVGNPAPAVYVARLAFSQTFDLGGGKVVNEGGPNELTDVRDRDVLAITVGRFSVVDVVDGNRYSNDATTEFFNWALFASGAFDYPADTRGYTWGVMGDLAKGWWSARGGIALEPYYANEARMDWRVQKSRGLMAEYEARYALRARPGACSLLLFWNTARMGSYEQVLANPALYDNDIVKTRADGRHKYGFALSLEQQLTSSMGAFMRLSWNDGHTESWAFTEIDRSLAVGLTQNGRPWRRPRNGTGGRFGPRFQGLRQFGTRLGAFLRFSSPTTGFKIKPGFSVRGWPEARGISNLIQRRITWNIRP